MRRFAASSILFAAAIPSLAAQTTWTGATSTQWNNAANWSAGVPTAVLDAIVPVTPNQPTALSGDQCRALTVQAGATINMSAANALTVRGNVTCSGSILGSVIEQAAGTVTTPGTGHIDELRIAAGAVTIAGANLGQVTQLAGVPLVTFSGTTTVTGLTNLQGAGMTGLAGSVLDTVNLTLGTSVPITAPPATMRVHTFWNSNSNWQPASGTVIFTGSGASSATVAPGTIWNDLEVEVLFGLVHAGDLRVNGALQLRSDLSLSSGTVVDLNRRAGLAFGCDLTGPTVTSLRIRQGVTAAGTINLPNATMDADGDMTFFVTGVLQIGGGTHHISDSIGMAGGLIAPPTSTIEFDGSGTITVANLSTLPNVRITGTSYTILDALVGGTFEHAVGAGTLNIFRCTVNGLCTLAGNLVSDFNNGVFDVNGGVVWQTASIITAPPATITCSGSWTSNGNFQPVSGLVVFDGNGAQSVTRPLFVWNSLRVGPSSQIGTTLPLVTTGLLDVQGQLTVSGNDLDVNGAMSVGGTLLAPSATRIRAHAGLTVGGSIQAAIARLDLDGNLSVAGTVTLGNGDHEASGNVVVTGTVTFPAGQRLVLDGAGTVDVVTTSPLPNVRVTGTDYTVQSLRLSQDLVQVGGILRIHSCRVDRDATFQGAGLTDSAIGTLDVRRHVVVQTTTPVTTPPRTILCGGDWSSNGSFAPASGLVVLDGAGAQLVAMPQFQWFNLRIGSTSSVNTGQSATTLGFLDVQGSLSVGGASIVCNGQLTVGSGGTLTLPAATTTTFGAAMDVQGSLSMPLATFTAGGNANVGAAGILIAGTGPHTFQAGLVVAGSLSLPPGTGLRFTGTGVVDVVPTNPVFGVEFAGALVRVTSLVCLGVINQTAGRLQIASLTGAANAVFAGTTVENDGAGQLDVAGNISFQTTNVVVTPPTLVRCGGTWTSNAQFLPTSGTVEMTGAGPQAMNSPQLFLATLSVISSSFVTFSSADVILQADLIVDGAVVAPNSQLEVRRDLTVGQFGTLQLSPNGTCTVARTLVNNGLISGPGAVTMVGAGSVSGVGLFADIAVDSAGEVTVQGNVNATGLLVQAGTLRFLAGANMAVSGDWNGLGGVLRGTSANVLDIGGKVELSGLTAHATGVPDIHCDSNWHSSASFAPTTSTVFLDGSGDLQPISGPLTFHNLDVTAGVRAVAEDLEIVATTVTVRAGAELAVDVLTATVTSPTVQVDGALSVRQGGVLEFGPLAAVNVSATGTLSLVGEWNAPATVEGQAGAGYTLTIDGGVEAMNYVFAHMGPTGVVIHSAATIAAVPRDLRGGLFRDGSPVPGSTLLRLDRSTPFNLRYVQFVDAGTSAFNIRSAGAGSIGITNDSGNFTGVAHEDDPGSVVDWLPPEHTAITQFTSRAAVHRVELGFASTSEIDVSRFRWLRATALAGPYIEVAGSPVAPLGGPSLGASYTATDLATVDTTKYFYRLEEILLHGEPRTLGQDFARPWPQQIRNAWFVGTNGGFADIGAAVAAANPGGYIVVQAGTYPAFTINKPVRIVPDGSGPVRIDTTLAKLVIRDIPAGSVDLGLYDLVIGSATSPFGVEVLNCDNTILMDNVQISTATGVLGLLVDDTRRVALQRCTISGDPGLRFANNSSGFVSLGTIDELDVTGNSTVTRCDVTPGTETIAPGSTVDARPLAMPALSMKCVWPGEKPVPMSIAQEPNTLFAIMFSLRRDYIDLTFVLPIDMVLLIEQTQAVPLLLGLSGPTGSQSLQLTAPGGANGWGVGLPLQLLELRATNGRMGTSRDVLFVP